MSSNNQIHLHCISFNSKNNKKAFVKGIDKMINQLISIFNIHLPIHSIYTQYYMCGVVKSVYKYFMILHIFNDVKIPNSLIINALCFLNAWYKSIAIFAVFYNFLVIQWRPVNSCVSKLSPTSTPHNILFKQLAAFPHRPTGERRIPPVTVTFTKRQRECWPSWDLTSQLLDWQTASLPAELPAELPGLGLPTAIVI